MPNFIDVKMHGTVSDPEERDNAERMGIEYDSEDIVLPGVLNVDRIESFYRCLIDHQGQDVYGVLVKMMSGDSYHVLDPYEEFVSRIA